MGDEIPKIVEILITDINKDNILSMYSIQNGVMENKKRLMACDREPTRPHSSLSVRFQHCMLRASYVIIGTGIIKTFWEIVGSFTN